MEKISKMDEAISQAWSQKRLQIYGKGSSSPCLDLLRIDSVLCSACRDVDLVIIEVFITVISILY